MAGRAYLGTSGFAYPEWKGRFYPQDIANSAMLPFYASRFPSVEINYTFQRTCSENMLAKWTSETPEGFVFSLKAHRSITHIKRLGEEAADPLVSFLSSVSPLGERLGPVLFQVPPNLKADVPRLDAFLARLPDGRRYAFEFRHGTWIDDAVYSSLEAAGAAWCVVDTDGIDAQLIRTSPGFVYIRLRKTAYEDEALMGWAKQIGETMADGGDVYCYFKHEDEGHGASFAQMLGEMIGGSAE